MVEDTTKDTTVEDIAIEQQQKRRHRNKLLFLMFAGCVSIILLVMGGYQLIEFSDSVAFCGQLCHDVMYPQYTAHQESPHSSVKCAECHVGSGADYLVKSKLSGIPLIFSTIGSTYHRPIPTPVENLRPARETCEQCHRPSRFAGDLVVTHTTYAQDEPNMKKTDIRVMRVGGGEAEVAQDIHWHIGAEVWYVPLNESRQEIGWIEVVGKDGKTTEYINRSQQNEITPERIKNEKRLMDCIDCHNRATHIFNSPSDLIDIAMLQGKIDSSLPFIKREGIKVLDPPNPSLEQANTRLEDIAKFYQTNYPQVSQEKQTSISAAIEALKEVARLTTFPHMKVDWKTYVDNVGHTESSPGCFRCHGKLVATSGAQQGKAIDADCSSCHYFSLDVIQPQK